MYNECFPLWLVLQSKVEHPHPALPLLSLGLIHRWRWSLAAGRRWEVMAVHHPRLGESCLWRGQLQLRGAPHRLLLLVVVKGFGGEVPIQIPFFQIEMQNWSGITGT